LRNVFRSLKQGLEKKTERELGLVPSATNKSTKPSITFRVYIPPFQRLNIQQSGLWVFGNTLELGSWKHGAIALNDDGQDGDQVRQDHVWSKRVNFPSLPQNLQYTFLPFGPHRKRAGKDPIPRIRSFLFFYMQDFSAQSRKAAVYTPVHLFGYSDYGHLLLAGTDFVHPNRFGNQIIAQSIFPFLDLP